MDLKTLSLELYYQPVVVTLKSDSDSYTRYGKCIEGILATRIWGEWYNNENCISTVTAIIVRTDDRAFNIPCKDIESLQRASSFA